MKKVCENCAKNGVCRSACGDLFGFCRSSFEPKKTFTLYRSARLRDDLNCAFILRSWEDVEEWREEYDVYGEEAAVLPVTLTAEEYDLAERIAEASEDINPYEYEAKYVHFDSAVDAVLGGDLESVADWLEEYGYEKLAEEVRSAM